MTNRLMILASDTSGTGGIETTVRGVIAAAADRFGHANVSVLSLHPSPERGHAGVAIRSAQPVHERGRVRPAVQFRYATMVIADAVAHRERVTAILCLHPGFVAVAAAAAATARAPYAVAAYGIDVWGRLPRRDLVALRRATAIWSISNFTSEVLRQRHGVDDARIRPWVLGLSEVPAPRARLPLGTPTVLTVARLTRRNAYKGVDTLLMSWPKVARLVPGAILDIVGDGDNAPELQRLSELLGVSSSVRFRGRVSDAERDAAYATADVFALPGRVSLGRRPEGEGLGLVFLEAQAAGVPVIVGHGGGAPETVVPDKTGVLVNPWDDRAVADAIVSLLHDEPRRRQMGGAGRRFVLENRSPVAARASLDALLDELVGAA